MVLHHSEINSPETNRPYLLMALGHYQYHTNDMDGVREATAYRGKSQRGVQCLNKLVRASGMSGAIKVLDDQHVM